MKKSIAVMATLDTKGDQIEYVKDIIESRGHEVILIDVGVLGDPTCTPSITKNEVALAAGSTLERIIRFNDEAKAMDLMMQGAIRIVGDLDKEGRLDGILAAGGSMGTSLALGVFDTLPLYMPKVLLSTLAYSHAIDPDLASNGIIMIQWAGGLWGMNEMVERVLEQAAAVISASAEVYRRKTRTKKKTIGVTSLGMIGTRYLKNLKPALEARGYEVIVFHATGMSTRVMEKAIDQGLIDAVFDLMAERELLNHVVESLLSAGPLRLEAAGKKGIPQIVALKGPLAFHWAPYKPLPEKFKNRSIFVHNSLLWPIRADQDESLNMAKLFSEKLNKAMGPTILLIPHSIVPTGAGIVTLDENDTIEEAVKTVKKLIKPEIRLIEMDMSTEDPNFTDEVVNLLEELIVH